MNNSIHFNKKDECCGCGACSLVCPKECIKMEEDEEGFLYPVINDALCINCGVCLKHCPMLNKPNIEQSLQKSYVAYHNDTKIRLKSSSGGVFSALAKLELEKGGVVFGAAFDEGFSVHHVMIESVNELDTVLESKYLQSRIEDTFLKAKEYLEEGRNVLFSGTGCQIAGLNAYLNHTYEKLITVDVLCHGTPSPKLWKRYLSEKVRNYNDDIKQVHFRNKTTGWKDYSISIEFNNGKLYQQTHVHDDYMRLFLNDICLRPSCHDCKFKPNCTQSDITIGDSWGIEKYMPEMDDDLGCSLIMIHSEKGEAWLKDISSNLNIKQAELDSVFQPMLISSAKPHPRRTRFFSLLNEGGTMEALMKILEQTLYERIIDKFKRTFLEK